MGRKVNFVSKATDGTYTVTIKGNTMSVADSEGNSGFKTFSEGERFDIGKGFWNCFKQIKDERKNFGIGDMVKIIDDGELYDTYWKWFEDFEMAKKYKMYGNPSTACLYKVVAIGPHQDNPNQIVIAIESNQGDIYLIRDAGLRKA